MPSRSRRNPWTGKSGESTINPHSLPRRVKSETLHMFDPSNSTYLKDLLKDIMEAPSVKVTPENAIFKFYKNCTNAFKDVLQQFQGVFGKEGKH